MDIHFHIHYIKIYNYFICNKDNKQMDRLRKMFGLPILIKPTKREMKEIYDKVKINKLRLMSGGKKKKVVSKKKKVVSMKK